MHHLLTTARLGGRLADMLVSKSEIDDLLKAVAAQEFGPHGSMAERRQWWIMREALEAMLHRRAISLQDELLQPSIARLERIAERLERIAARWPQPP